MYCRMGLHSIHPEFQNIQYLGIYNPRINKVYRIAVENISEDVIREVEKDVIGYQDQTVCVLQAVFRTCEGYC